MSTAAYYAHALYELGEQHPEKTREYLRNLRAALRARGHEKLLPRILSECEKIDVQRRRTARHREVTPQMRRSDELLQLYRRLIATK